MKQLKRIAFQYATFAFVMLVMSCAKDFQGDIDDLNNKYNNIDSRVKTLETQVSSMNSQMTQLSVLATAVESGFYITSVKTTTDGYELTLSNGRVFVLQKGPNNTLTPAPVISMTLINGIYYWTINGMLITGGDGLPMKATGTTPIVQYNYVTQQWTISIDGGVTFQNVNIFASIVINDTVLMQIINNYISQNSTTFISQEVLFQIISTYIQENYAKIFNYEILNQVIFNYVDLHYTTIFNYDVLTQIFNQYNFEYAAKHIDVDVITNILTNFIKENKEIFINNEVLYEIIKNYIEVNKIDIFSNELIIEVINNYIVNNTNFINVELLQQIVYNYIEEHQDIVINNEVIKNVLIDYVQKYYLQIFSQTILNQVITNYITQNKTTIFNKTLIQEIVNNYVKNNYNTLIDETIIRQIINNYIEVNKTTIISEEVLYEVINNYFKKNYNIFIDETFIQTIINNYVSEHKTTIIDIDIVKQVVNKYVQQYYVEIFNETILTKIISAYFEKNTTIIKEYVGQSVGIIKDITVNDETAVVTLSDGKKIQLVVYDAYARIRDRVQSIVVVPNSKGHITYGNYKQLSYYVTPSNITDVIVSKYFQGKMILEFIVLDEYGNLTTMEVPNKKVDSYNGLLNVMMPTALSSSTATSIALRVQDPVDKDKGGTDYVTSFTPIDYEGIWVNPVY